LRRNTCTGWGTVILYVTVVIAPLPLAHGHTGGGGLWHRICVVFFEGVSANELAHNYSSLAAIVVFEANDDHAMPAETLAPAVDAIFFGDAARDVELVVARHANVIVPGIASETVIARIDRWDRHTTNVAKSCKIQRTEHKIHNGSVVWTPSEGSRFWRAGRGSSSIGIRVRWGKSRV
jgi:hypothetical protein